MCGIAGIVYDSDREVPSQGERVRRMIDLQRHRGPDGEGYYDDDGVSLGHCRLAILDLGEAGHQPMSTRDRWWITYNGEIYNFLELRAELASRGHRFRGRSDTEVLLAAYVEWGDDCVHRLRGMFAFAVWDAGRRRLFAARDRFGIKPFHYCLPDDGSLAFASEMKALLPFLEPPTVNRELAGAFIAWNLLQHEPAATMLDGILQLPAGHTLTWTPGEGARLRRYWRFEADAPAAAGEERLPTFAAAFRERFEEVVSLHLRSDVPVGSCLSGGLDSSAITCVMSRELTARGVWKQGWQHTFSAVFDERRIDESSYMAAVVEQTGCEPHYVRPTGERMLEDFDRWLWHLDEPVGSSSPYAQYCLARAAREQGIKVLLDGQGADEQLAGYRKFILVRLRELLAARRPVAAAREALAFFGSREILRTTRLVDGRRYLLRRPSEVAQLWPGGELPPRPEALSLSVTMNRRIEADLTRTSLPALLRFEDRNTMAHGVESRVPFLDHELAEWLATVPADMKLGGGWTKRLMREGLVGVLPEVVRTRKSKLGFLTPEPEWLAGPLRHWLHQTLSSPRHLADVIDLGGVRRLLALYERGNPTLALQNMLFRLSMFEAWAGLIAGRAALSIDAPAAGARAS